jgi:hypothetical protein
VNIRESECQSWRAAYVGAVLETDNFKLPDRINEAIAAIAQRLRSPVEPGSVDEKTIRASLVGLARLKAERLNNGS